MFRSIRFALPFLLLSVSTANHAAFDACRDYFPNQNPPKVSTSPGKIRDLCMSDFAILHSGESKTPVFVVERMSRATLIDAQDEERTDRFYEEARLPSSHRARLEDYKGSGYDRGHMAPAADMPSPEGMTQSFSLANMTPQVPAINRGIWAKNVEKATRKYVMRAKGDVYVFTGATFSDNPRTIGAGRVWVPDYLYKLVYDEAQNRAWAFWVANRDDMAMGQPPITYEELVKRTGIEFLPGISPRAGGGAVAGSAPSEPAPVVRTEPTSRTTAECGSKRTCKEMSSCEEAMHYLNNCGLTRLDRDGDGVPCETICR